MYIYIIGFMASGKSYLAKELESKLNIPSLDMDRKIEELAKLSIADIFERHSEKYFRNLETLFLSNLYSKKLDLLNLNHEQKSSQNLIVSTGGGVPLREKNRSLMKKSGIIIYLDTPFHIISQRIFENKKRPLANAKNLSSLESMYLNRKKVYESIADIRINYTK